MEPACIYDIQASWEDNLQRGPLWTGAIPERQLPLGEQWFDFLGFKVASRLGVPAGPLLDSRWIDFAARLGFDILTYKTIRTTASTGHAPPNVLYLQVDQQLRVGDADTPLLSTGQQLPAQGQQDAAAAAAGSAANTPAAAAGPSSTAAPVAPDVAITNSFGMPSMAREYLMADIPQAAAALRPGQVLVVSVTGTPHRPDGVSFLDDFVAAALLAKEAGARVIEANLSCPNVGSGQGALYTDAQQVSVLTSALVRALGPDVPLIIKVGAFNSRQQLEGVLSAAAAAGVRGVSGINGLSRPVVSADGAPALGPDRPTSGVCGAPIREAALEFVRTARDIINSRQLGLTLIGVGGVSCGAHVRDLLAAGADFVQSATGMMWNPLLAADYHRLVASHQPEGDQLSSNGRCQQQQQQQQQQQEAVMARSGPAGGAAQQAGLAGAVVAF